MLERIDKSVSCSDEFSTLFDVSKIHPDASFECYAYVRGGKHRFSRTGKPFITLYLQDIKGVVIPAYIFDIGNFKTDGLDLLKVKQSVVHISATENYSPRFGMSVIINSIAIVTSPSARMLSTFVGTAGNTSELYSQLVEKIKEHLGLKVNLPYDICTTSYMEFYQGRVGGQCKHYINMLRTLEAWATDMDTEEARELFVTFVLYVFVHNNYMAAVAEGNDDISLVSALTSSVSKYMKTLKAGAGAIEVIHLFFGYEPKDLFVRLVHQASQIHLRFTGEMSTYRALPVGLEGDAGYGKIKKYPSEVD